MKITKYNREDAKLYANALCMHVITLHIGNTAIRMDKIFPNTKRKGEIR